MRLPHAAFTQVQQQNKAEYFQLAALSAFTKAVKAGAAEWIRNGTDV